MDFYYVFQVAKSRTIIPIQVICRHVNQNINFKRQ